MRTSYAAVLGAIAAAEEKWADALAYYREAFVAQPSPKRLGALQETWKRLGGSPEALRVMLSGGQAGPAGHAGWEPTQWPVPAATLERLGGGSWSPRDLEGKTTLVVVWATWCGPCVDELPLVERLYERIKDRPDVAVVTLNVDDNPALAEALAKRNQYHFPVVMAADYWDTLGVEKALPTNWIADSAAVVRLERRGFGTAPGDRQGERWLDDVLARLEGRTPRAETATGP
jgi:thiol-disulfide isomerase/thioredoxin